MYVALSCYWIFCALWMNMKSYRAIIKCIISQLTEVEVERENVYRHYQMTCIRINWQWQCSNVRHHSKRRLEMAQRLSGRATGGQVLQLHTSLAAAAAAAAARVVSCSRWPSQHVCIDSASASSHAASLHDSASQPAKFFCLRRCRVPSDCILLPPVFRRLCRRRQSGQRRGSLFYVAALLRSPPPP